jgi:hypothetical protein
VPWLGITYPLSHTHTQDSDGSTGRREGTGEGAGVKGASGAQAWPAVAERVR